MDPYQVLIWSLALAGVVFLVAVVLVCSLVVYAAFSGHLAHRRDQTKLDARERERDRADDE